MGVLGLCPFVQKACPDVVKYLPNRLRALAGQKIAIDGTLITQRLHFAPVPHEYRHILGWFRLMKEFQDAGVSAICVFDGDERSVAKARETERRREARKLTTARATIEFDRMQRLEKLAAVVNDFSNIPQEETKQVSELFARIVSEQTAFPAAKLSRDYQWDLQEEDLVLFAEGDPSEFSSWSESEPSGSEYYIDRWDALNDDESSPPLDYPTSPINADQNIDEGRPVLPPLYQHSSILETLYTQFQSSVDKLASLTPMAREAASAATEEDARIEYSMSKTQLQLTAEETRFWAELASDAPMDPSEALQSLTGRARALSESYRRRTNPPTTRTYEECKALLRAMGVPCIDSVGSYEAEALAASIVRHGLADYVASEDTDVVVYEAPLLRNLTARNAPLSVWSGADIRSALQLDRETFVDFALLLGTDFTQRIKNVGPARALKFLREHKNIEGVLAAEPKYPPRLAPNAYLHEVAEARRVFETLPPVPDVRLLEQDKDAEEMAEILQRCRLGRLLFNSEEWDYEWALEGNYELSQNNFGDDPSAS
ncbi:hypothetical protein MKEN_00430400 [Mycena kentingensis (nom. inval.)]|nr:hypothetical protein MKEN_00430400 [Mycena kentingensis (nom. inval.)]